MVRLDSHIAWAPKDVDYPKHKLRAKFFSDIGQKIEAKYPMTKSVTAGYRFFHNVSLMHMTD